MSYMIDGIDYGPLGPLLGKWTGDKGLDMSPEMDGSTDRNPYLEEITFTTAGAAENAEEQNLVAVKYHQIVRKQSNGKIFHDQIGHWIYEPDTGLVMHSLSIPRGVTLLAGGSIEEQNGATTFSVKASCENQDFGITQSPFMLSKAKTQAFEMVMRVEGMTLEYRQATQLFIYGKDFNHVDKSQLTKLVYD